MLIAMRSNEVYSSMVGSPPPLVCPQPNRIPPQGVLKSGRGLPHSIGVDRELGRQPERGSAYFRFPLAPLRRCAAAFKLLVESRK